MDLGLDGTVVRTMCKAVACAGKIGTGFPFLAFGLRVLVVYATSSPYEGPCLQRSLSNCDDKHARIRI